MSFNTFADKAAYESHTPSTTDSEVSLISDTKELRYNGVNVEVDIPKWGDALYVENTGDANNLVKHYIDGASLNASLLPNTYSPVGVVLDVTDKDVTVHYYKGYNNGDNTEQWASAWLYDITATVDGSEHSIVFRQPKDSGYLTVGAFTYTSSTQEEFAQDLDTWLRANQGGTAAGGTWNYNWHCEYMENYAGEMKPIVIVDNMVDYRQYVSDGIVASGATASANMANMIPAYSDSVGYVRNNGGSGYRTGANLKRMIEYWSTNGDTPTANVPLNASNTIVKLSEFTNNAYCTDLRNAYGTYEKYIESLMLSIPCLRRIQGQERGKELEWNQKLAVKIHKNLRGTEIATFKPFYWTQSLDIKSEGLTAGNWVVPNEVGLYKIMSKLTYGLSGITTANCDQFNKTLDKMGGNLVSVSQVRWSCVRNSYRYAWYFSNAGSLYDSYFNYRFRISAVVVISLL